MTRTGAPAHTAGAPKPGGPKHRGPHIGPFALVSKTGLTILAVGLAVLAGGIIGLTVTYHGRYTPPHVAAPKPVLPPVGHAQTPPPPQDDQVAPPVSITIPVIGVRARLIHLGLTSTGALQVPSTITVAGWYTGSPAPGAIGSSIIAGHVDSVAGPGVFYRLNTLHPGDRIYVRERNGRVAAFGVNAIHLYPKDYFPTLKVYGATPTPQLRLITCGGTFDPDTGHYLSNVVVYATLVS